MTSLSLDHVELYVTNCDTAASELISNYDFQIAGQSEPRAVSHQTIALRQGDTLLLVTEGFTEEHPATAYVMAHGDGVGDIAFRTPHVHETFTAAVAAGAHPISAPLEVDGTITATIGVVGDVRHTLLQRNAADNPDILPPGLEPIPTTQHSQSTGLLKLDHIAILVEAGELEAIVNFYNSALAFRRIFEERFTVGSQAMNSEVVQNHAEDVTFTIIEPDLTHEPGQIDDFIKAHDGSGVQHLAFLVDDIVDSVNRLKQNGVNFLTTPDTYYDLLNNRIQPVKHSAAELRAQGILVDADHSGQLFQIFTRSTHPRNTLFFEIIERIGAKTFGRGNVRALYEAVELERTTAESGHGV